MKKIYFLYILLYEVNPMYIRKTEKTNQMLDPLVDDQEENIPFLYSPEHFEDFFFDDIKDIKKENQEIVKQNLRKKNTTLLYCLSVIGTLLAFISIITNYFTSPLDQRRIIGIITSVLQILISLCFLTFREYTSILKWIGLLYLFIIAWLFFLSAFVISQLGSYEGIYGNLSGSNQYSDYAIPIWIGSHMAWYTAGIGLLLQYTKLTHYEIALFCLN